MQREDIRYGQRVRVNLPGVGDHGHLGTIKGIHAGVCTVHLDRDQRPRHMVVFFAGDLERVADDQPSETASGASQTR